MPGPKRELDIDAAELLRQAAVLVLGGDHIDVGAGAKSTHHECRKEVRLAGARVPEHGDVRVGVTALIEWIDQHGRAGGCVAADEEPARFLKIRLVPWK